MENKECSNCVYKFANIKGWKFEPRREDIFEYYLPMMIENQKLPCNHVILKENMYEDYSTPWEIFKYHDPHWSLTASQESNNNKDDDEALNKSKKSFIYVFTNLKKNGKTNFFRKAGCGTWNQQNNKVVLNKEGEVIGSDKGFAFQVSEQDMDKIGDNYGSWTMHEYSLKPTVRMPHIDEYAICKIRKELGVEDEDASGSVDNNVAHYNQLPVVQVEDDQLLDQSILGLPVEGSVPHQDYGNGTYTDMLLQHTVGGSTIMNSEPCLPNHEQDPNQFSSEIIMLSSQAVDIVSHDQHCGEWNVYANMLLQPAEEGMSSNIIDFPQSQSLRKRKNSEVTTVTKKHKKQKYLVFN